LSFGELPLQVPEPPDDVEPDAVAELAVVVTLDVWLL